MGKIVTMVGYCHTKCKPFGIQWLHEGDSYTAVGSYSVSGSGDDAQNKEMHGNFYVSPQYKCRHCDNSSVFMCGNCGTIGCWDGVSQRVTCKNCNYEQNLGGTITDAKGSSGQ
ncbi:MAG: hypothetical protein J1G38_04795 [Clostridiales bacterium]|nr:hypothetical protein [Clostridiales bacterium]